MTRKIQAQIGCIRIGEGCPIAVQTMCNTHTFNVEDTVAQCRAMAAAGADIIRITVPGLRDVPHMKSIREILRSEGIMTPLVADIHFSSETAIAVAPFVEKVRINPGNFHKDFDEASRQLSKLLDVCRENGTAIRIGLNHGSLGDRITNLYGNTPQAMAEAAMEWINLCKSNDFYNVTISLKSSNTLVMTEAYRCLYRKMEESGVIFPLHVGVTEAGNGDSGRIKSCVGISALLSEGIGDTLRVSLTEDPVNEIPVGKYLADRYDGKLRSSLRSLKVEGRKAEAVYESPSRERLLLDFSCDFGKRLLDKELDEVKISGTYMSEDGPVDIVASGTGSYLEDELMQAARRRFYKPEYIACPGCGRTMYNLQDAFEKVKARTGHLKNIVIAVMGCIVNGPGEMADADWGYVGEGNGKVSIYRGKEPVLRHVPEEEAVDRLVELIESNIE
ncbi:MAG: (E)-4-hydroxy-3-methylbut-2-enyl-diphosphate synthase [Bacteroidales bacterium]|nr:(E)-4-hydroxy-3-methylbut-2-enyl-diphosphate synthase [Bacteroidales bacterium]MDY2860271.1 (E)-4-hydroxy-3-methylbut-2-enyl-diphosphate synthase [Candidatus Cryptobacteroides sp.]MDY5443504.1 (E)-4-hydroxy-3-methylbut-2-enyl-diphosphate synthase [Candidatus Cryptobacteroides sp.]